MWFRLKSALCAALLAAPVYGDGARIVASWSDWAAEKSIKSGQIVVLKDGVVQGRGALGGAEGPVEMASLSKAITGVCVYQLVSEGVLSWSDSVDDVMQRASGPLASVTLSELLVHSGGLWPDSTQGPMVGWRGAGVPVYADVVTGISERRLRAKRYRYNNENYGVIAAMIEARTAEPYAEVCARKTGLRAGSSPLTGRFAAWGGWRLDLAEYGRFYWSAFQDHDPSTAPAAEMGGGTHYGLGTVWRQARGGGYNFWHFGALCFADGPNLFTHTVLFANGWSAVSHVSGCPQEDWFVSLDQAIVRGVFQ